MKAKQCEELKAGPLLKLVEIVLHSNSSTTPKLLVFKLKQLHLNKLKRLEIHLLLGLQVINLPTVTEKVSGCP